MSKGIDIIFGMMVDNSDFVKKLKQSSEQVEQFKRKGESANGSLGRFKNGSTSVIASLGKFVKVAAIAKFGFDQFSTAVKRNQKLATHLSTAWTVTKLRVNDFFVAIATGDWSKFRKGLRESIADANELAESARTAALAVRMLQAEQEGDEAKREMAEADTKNETLTEEQIRSGSDRYQKASDKKIGKLEAEKAGNTKEILDEFRKAGFVGDEASLMYYVRHYVATNKNYDHKKAELDKYNNAVEALKLASRRLNWGRTHEYPTKEELAALENDLKKANEDLAKYTDKQVKEFTTANKLIARSAVNEEEVKDNPDKINVSRVVELSQRSNEISTNIGTITREKKDNLDDLQATLDRKKQIEEEKKELRKLYLQGGDDSDSGETKQQKYVRNLKFGIDMLAIQKGEEAKYTVEGQALYQEYFDNKKKLYKKDSKEYQDVMLEEARYNADFTKRVEEENKKLAEMAKKIKPHSFLLDIGVDNRTVGELEKDIADITERISRSKNAEVRIKLIAERKLLEDRKNKLENGEDVNGVTMRPFELLPVAPIRKKDGGLSKHMKGIVKNTKLFNNLAKAIRGVGDVMRATGNESKAMARAMAMVNAAASIAMMISIMIEKTKTTLTIWDWIAGVTAGTATVVAMAAQLRSINTSKFAEGGIVPGNNTIGDMTIARVNSGEMILNTRQQKNLFNLLNSNTTTASQPQEIIMKVKGKDLQGVLNNYNNKLSKLK